MKFKPAVYGLIISFIVVLLAGGILSPFLIHASQLNKRQNISIHSIADIKSWILDIISADNHTIILNAAEVNKAYRWVNSTGAINPTLQILSNKEYLIKTENPTDEQHQLIIEKINGNQITEIGNGDDILPQKNSIFKFKSIQPGELNYHCRYHPDYMKGTIKVTQQ